MHNFLFNKTNTFCISLETNGERWLKIQKRFDKHNLQVTRWNASQEKDLVDNFHGGLHSGQKGCAQSHILLWRHILQQNLEYALILEDDACFDKDWRQKLDDFLQFPTDWDAIFLNASEPMTPTYTWCNVQDQYLTGGYILSQQGARHILEMFDGCFYSSDWMTTRLQTHGLSYSYFPWLIIQEGNESSIGSNYEADRAKVIRCLQDIDYSLQNYDT
jgi:glycosyl transferase family 25